VTAFPSPSAVPTARKPTPVAVQVRCARPQDLQTLASLLTASFHSRQGWRQWIYPLLRLAIYEDLRTRLTTATQPKPYACLVAHWITGAIAPAQTAIFFPTPPEAPIQLVLDSTAGSTTATENAPKGHSSPPITVPTPVPNTPVPTTPVPSPPVPTQIVGTLEVSPRVAWPWGNASPSELYISNLAVAADCRRRGIARSLLLACEHQARVWGYQDLYLHVLENNYPARQLYARLGYNLSTTLLSWPSLQLGQSQRLLLHKRLG
jgi:ribosomal protein S18 acetylase RimI-like enzyme